METKSEKHFTDRIEELRGLPKGWYWDVGEPISSEILADVPAIVHKLVNEVGLPYPFVFPSPDGSLTLEWNSGGWCLTYDLDLNGSGYIHAWHPDKATLGLEVILVDRTLLSTEGITLLQAVAGKQPI